MLRWRHPRLAQELADEQRVEKQAAIRIPEQRQSLPKLLLVRADHGGVEHEIAARTVLYERTPFAIEQEAAWRLDVVGT